MHIKEYDITFLVKYDILKDFCFVFYNNTDLHMIIHTNRWFIV